MDCALSVTVKIPHAGAGGMTNLLHNVSYGVALIAAMKFDRRDFHSLQ
jgi:hypothetical protein